MSTEDVRVRDNSSGRANDRDEDGGIGKRNHSAARIQTEPDVRRASLVPSLAGSLREQLSSSVPSQSDEVLLPVAGWHSSVFAPPASLWASRRQSFTSLPEAGAAAAERTASAQILKDVPEAYHQPLVSSFEPSSPEDGSNLNRSLQIDMKALVGDAVGNMSISPASRDVVLAARRGLFIIDLEAPLEVPRFLPQGGTWDVADVQWNPHPSRAEYIVSTSSEKLLIWNLLLVGKTSIEHILQAHYRAITDINWHTTECDTVVSTGIDSWLWAWDLREPRKPILGLSAFNSGATQVKWNRQDANMIASSHSDEVYIWDRRKGSLPIHKFKAHTSKIYGIDWSHDSRNEIITCSLDRSIKVWDISEPDDARKPKTTFNTSYPVWRARSLPFGKGVLSLAQRGETTLEMYCNANPAAPVETFAGHTDTVKEFVWRRGGDDEFQLITWSKDRTLRFWPVDAEMMQKVGYTANQDKPRGRSRSKAEREQTISFRSPPEGMEYFPALSAPVGHRSILAEVRASMPPRHALVLQTLSGPSSGAPYTEGRLHPMTTGNNKPLVLSSVRSQGGTMSRGNNGIKGVARMDAFTWLSNVKVGERRGSSSGPTSGANSANASRLNSRSRPSSGTDYHANEPGRKKSDSQSWGGEEKREGDGSSQSLQDEITSVLTKLSASKIKLEKHDLAKKRNCTLGLHGPWGGSSSVFIRVTFTFPRDYPQAAYPDGVPMVDVERNPLISMKDRAYILKRLRIISERKRPCLEACLRFLLFAEEDEELDETLLMDSESSSEEEDGEHAARKNKDFSAAYMRNNKNLLEPRTSQGTFGPNGELICFFRAPPRIVRNVLRGLTDAEDATVASSEEPSPAPEIPPRMFQSPSLISDAVRRLKLAATDRQAKAADLHRSDEGGQQGQNILRIMTNVLTFSQHKVRRDSETKPLGDILKSYALVPPHRSTVFLTSTANIAGADRKVAGRYVFKAESLVEVCRQNAEVAKEYGRFDHQRVFESLGAVLPAKAKVDDLTLDSFAADLIKRLYGDFSQTKDIQMLAILSAIVLQTRVPRPFLLFEEKRPDVQRATLKPSGVDYFSLASRDTTAPPPWAALSLGRSSSPPPPPPPAPPPPPEQLAPTASISSSSRGSWSSLFNTGSVRQFMSGVQDSLKEGLTTPLEVPGFNVSTSDTPVQSAAAGVGLAGRAERTGRATTATAGSVAAPSATSAGSGGSTGSASGAMVGGTGSGDSPGVRRKVGFKRGESSTSVGSPTKTSRSWNETAPLSVRPSLPASSIVQRRAPLAPVVDPSNVVKSRKTLVFRAPKTLPKPLPPFDECFVLQFISHVKVYAEMLWRWELYHKRLELLKAVSKHGYLNENTERHKIGIARMCQSPECGVIIPQGRSVCPSCGSSAPRASCTICRLPVKGLSRSCVHCFHVTHVSCWNKLDVPICPAGCGCFCNGMDESQTRPSTRLGWSGTASSNALLLS